VKSAKSTFPLLEAVSELQLTRIASWPRLRVLAWHGEVLYASRGYTLLRGVPADPQIPWSTVGYFNPAWWRRFSSSGRLTCRLCRDGFHGLVALSSGHLVAAVPGAVITLAPGNEEFKVTHRVDRGTRPLNLTVTNRDWVFWGEYFDNVGRDEVSIYGSQERGEKWEVVHTFPKGTVRHVHNIVYDRWDDCLWVLTGDYGNECKIIRASCNWKDVDVVLSGDQKTRAVALVPTREALYFASDTPLEANYIYRLDRSGALGRIATISGSSFYGCRAGDALFFSTAVEPSQVNHDRNVHLYGSLGGRSWSSFLAWPKDRWPMRLFQYGNAVLPTGDNATDMLALSCVAVEGDDLQTTLWRIIDPAERGQIGSSVI